MKRLNYKVEDLDEIYNFHIKVISIQIHKISYNILKIYWSLPPFETTVGSATMSIVWWEPYHHLRRW
jgi:hypothetical protein